LEHAYLPGSHRADEILTANPNALQYTHIFNMGTHMKTTIEVSDALLTSAKKLAQKNQTTLRALIEEGLRRVVNDQPIKAKSAFKLADARVRGKAMLMPDAQQWRELETEHLAATVNGAAASKKTRK
jgi:hypothetical protein